MNGYEDLKFRSFMDTFNNVNDNFKDIFAQLSDGQGSLILENPENPFTRGLTIEAQPRGKKMQRLESMSGGEKSLTALAFVFALQRYMPAPFYAFDEVDMHLDGINAEKLAQMIKTQSSNTQFIVVSLRKPMIESADRTIGVTQKNNGIGKSNRGKNYMASNPQDGIEILVEMAKTGKIDSWNIDIVDVTDKFLHELVELKTHNLRLTGRTLFFAAVLLRLKSDILSNHLAPQNQDEDQAAYDEILDDFEPDFDNEDYANTANVMTSIGKALTRRTSV
ncbi:MAG: segregation/condensation protein A [Desulfobacterales bacterium]|nr:segregation/condensation protein A [Desulfobacterales bacterium]